jgi:hypothetical protein
VLRKAGPHHWLTICSCTGSHEGGGKGANVFRFPESGMTFLRIVIPPILLFEHDLFGKPVSTFPDHALARETSAELRGRVLTPLEREPRRCIRARG